MTLREIYRLSNKFSTSHFFEINIICQFHQQHGNHLATLDYCEMIINVSPVTSDNKCISREIRTVEMCLLSRARRKYLRLPQRNEKTGNTVSFAV